MNATPDHLDDELLSALLDGEAVSDSRVEADAHLRACDRCAGRQEELAAARAAFVAAPVEPVDELTRRRLLAEALAAAGQEPAGEAATGPVRARARWTARHPGVIGSAAAVVLAVLVGIPFVVGDDTKSKDADTTLAAEAPSAVAAQESASAYLGDLGDLSNRESLRLRLSGPDQFDTSLGYSSPVEPGPSPAAGAPSAAPMPASAPAAGALASTTTAPMSAGRTSGGGGSGSAEKAAKAPVADSAADASTSNAAQRRDEAAVGRERAEADACVAALLDGPARNGRLTASGTGTFRGRPAIAAVFDLEGGRIAFVADRTGCAVLDRFSV